MSRAVNDLELIRRLIDGRLLDVRTSMAGVCVSFDANTMTASVRPAVRVQAVDSDSPPEVDTLPVFEGVPVLYPRTGAGILYLPLSPGDPVRLEWSEEDDGEFYESPSAPVPVNPTSLRRHGGALVCRPEGCRGSGALGPESPSRALLGRAGGPSVAIDADGVIVGGSDGEELPVTAEKLLNALVNAITASATAPTDGGSAFKANLLAALGQIDPSTIAATRVRLK